MFRTPCDVASRRCVALRASTPPMAAWGWRGAARLTLKPPVAALMADGSWLMAINGGTPMGLPPQRGDAIMPPLAALMADGSWLMDIDSEMPPPHRMPFGQWRVRA
ncbi:MAG: hypothetical protein IKX30_06325 [Victivallales bacterium]|nr:hypothetical protein [Victivallales bacterium]